MLYITKVNKASTNISLNYLESEHIWGRIVKATYTFSILDARYTDQDDALLDGIDALKAVYLKPNIVAKIGIDEFRNGLVTSVDIPDGAHVARQDASIIIEERERVFDDSVLSNLTANIPSPQDVESFGESFECSRGANSYSYTRSINLKYRQDAGGQFLEKAYLFLKGVYFNSRPAYGYLEDGISEFGRFNAGFRPLLSEKYDILNKEVSLTENFDSARITTNGDISYSESSTHSISLDVDGYTTKNYDVEIKALQEPLEVNVISGVHFSLNNILSSNTGQFRYPYSIEKTIKTDGGAASFSVEFSSNPRKNGLNNIEYRASESLNGPYSDYSFSLDVISRGPNRIVAFERAKEYWSGHYDYGYIKIPAMFSITSGQLFEKSRDTNFEPFSRKISETVVFTTDPTYNSNDNILKSSVQIKDAFPVDRNQIVAVLGDSEKVGRRGAGKTLGTRNITVEMVDKNQASLESEALVLAAAEIPNATYYDLDSKTSSFSPIDGISSANINYIFFN